MAETNKTVNYGLNIFGDEQSSMTFKEFRQAIAGIGESAEDFSNMQIIDSILKQCAEDIVAVLGASKNYTEEQIAQYKSENETLIKEDEDSGALILGGEDGKPLEIRDETFTSTINKGILTTLGVDLSDLGVRISNYLLSCDDDDHLQLSYSPKK